MVSVTLHVYDLSQGMARQLSPALLGKTIDGVWHTGVLVFGKEYFFGGGGIQAMDPQLVVARYGMQPVRTVALGETTKTQQELETYLRANSARFTDATYDLLRHNCNNFSNEVSRFLVGTGIPQYILDLPNEALNTPMGAMLRPMLENMQNQMHAGADLPFAIPFNDPSRANLAVPPAPASVQTTTTLASRKFKVSGTPSLHLEKMATRIETLNEGRKVLREEEVAALKGLVAHASADAELKEAEASTSQQWWQVLSKLLSEGHESSFFFPALGVFRVLLLIPSKATDASAEKKAAFETLVKVTETEPSPLTSAQKSLLMSVLVNAFSNAGFSDLALASSGRFLPFVFATITDASTDQETRVVSSHVLSNCSLALKMGEEAVATTIVCGAVETLDRFSRLQHSSTSPEQQKTIEGIIVALGRLLHNFEAARNLSVDLGLSEVLRRLHTAPGLNAIQPLLSEVVAMI